MNVLFVCTGNTCRSAMAEGLCREEALKQGRDLHAMSAGISVFSPEPATPFAVQAAKALGADISNHCAKMVNGVLLGSADSVYCMTQGQLDVLKLTFPAYTGKIKTLCGATDVLDPFGGTLEAYNQVALQLQEAVCAVVRRGR